jgi:hypothetical protein
MLTTKALAFIDEYENQRMPSSDNEFDNSKEEIYDIDEESDDSGEQSDNDEEVVSNKNHALRMGPPTGPESLRDAIESACQPVLAKTLLEICEHNEASRHLATALLSPSHAPATYQGTKRKASSAT